MSGRDDESAAIARLEMAIARDRPGPLGLHFDVSVDSSDLYIVLAALKRETERANGVTAHLVSLDKIHSTLGEHLTRIELASQLSRRLFELVELARPTE